ncbi:hypothetical protein JZU46_03720 [bacterium]|jgi:hypothetical protein|nr:hypothetical protein [bacterium]
MSIYTALKTPLKGDSKTCLVTDVAGFISSNLQEVLRKLNQRHLADISKVPCLLGYAFAQLVGKGGLELAMSWYFKNVDSSAC